MKIIVFAALYGGFFGLVELIGRNTHIQKETSRKAAHILAGTSAAFLPFVLSFREITYLSLLFIPVMLVSKRINFLSSIHAVTRRTYGEIYFPCSIAITALLFPQRPLYIYGLLIMAISDGFASVIGQKYGRSSYTLLAGRKSYVGSLTFFVSALAVGLAVMLSFGTALLPALVLSTALAGFLTLVEGSLSHGLDNLLLPPMASGLLLVLMKLYSLS